MSRFTFAGTVVIVSFLWNVGLRDMWHRGAEPNAIIGFMTAVIGLANVVVIYLYAAELWAT